MVTHLAAVFIKRLNMKVSEANQKNCSVVCVTSSNRSKEADKETYHPIWFLSSMGVSNIRIGGIWNTNSFQIFGHIGSAFPARPFLKKMCHGAVGRGDWWLGALSGNSSSFVSHALKAESSCACSMVLFSVEYIGIWIFYSIWYNEPSLYILTQWILYAHPGGCLTASKQHVALGLELGSDEISNPNPTWTCQGLFMKHKACMLPHPINDTFSPGKKELQKSL